MLIMMRELMIGGQFYTIYSEIDLPEWPIIQLEDLLFWIQIWMSKSGMMGLKSHISNLSAPIESRWQKHSWLIV